VIYKNISIVINKMGNCATCCGNAGANEIVTENKYNKVKGVAHDNNYGSANEYIGGAYPTNGKKGKLSALFFLLFVCLND
jgi:hypothetical protein